MSTYRRIYPRSYRSTSYLTTVFVELPLKSHSRMTTNLSTEKPFPLDTDRGHVSKHTVNINDDEDLSCKPKRSKYLNQLSNVNLFFLKLPY